MTTSKARGLLALSPIIVFLAVYLVSSLVTGDFYKIPVSSAFLIASIYAVIISRGSLKDRLEAFSSGAADSKILLMIWIFVLAGAFASSAKAIGAVDATVALALKIIPSNMLYAGLFVTASFISLSIGTSVGTIVALAPIAAGIAEQTGSGLGLVAAIIVGGAFFGDNLSFISDTTIASTKAAGCQMNEKFKANIKIAIPAFIVAVAIYLIMGQSVSVTGEAMDGARSGLSAAAGQWWRMIPYLVVLVLAIAGVNVTAVLAIGVALNGAIGLGTALISGPQTPGALTWSSYLSSMGEGISGMGDLIIVTLLAGGMMALIRRGGGLDLIIEGLAGKARGKRSAYLSIAVLVSLANVCTANNTIAIISVGGIAKDIEDRFGLSARKVASVLDTFSCLIQGIIPYGAQILMASALTGISGPEIIGHLYYPFALGIASLIAILL